MACKIPHKIDLSSAFATVCSAFSAKFNVSRTTTVAYEHLFSALERTVEAVPVLSNIIISKTEDGVSQYKCGCASLKDGLKYTQSSDTIPTGETAAHLLGEEARLPADLTANLFTLHAVHYTDGIMFFLVVNHAITDGPSIFIIVDTFLQFLASAVDPTFVVTIPPTSNRDIIAEVLANPLGHTKLDESSLLINSHPNKLTFPTLTDSNVDVNNGCIRMDYRELSVDVTAGIIRNCRKHGVTFQALLSAASSLAFIKLLHSSGQMNEIKWNAPIIQMTPANLRRYLRSSEGEEDQSVERVVAMGAAFLRWKMSPLQNYETLSQRLFWSDFVTTEAHKPIQDTVNSPYLLQSVVGGESGSIPYETQTYSLTTTSLGNVTAVKQHYGESVTVSDVFMTVGLWSQSQEQFDHPYVPPAMINTNSPGYVLMHAYTVFGRLKLTGEYFGYSAQFITPYYAELERILCVAGRTEDEGEGGAEGVTVGDVFKLD